MCCSGENMLRLRSHDNKEFKVAASAAALSQTIKFATEDVLDDSDSGLVIPIPKVDWEILAKVLEYCEVHADAGKTRAEMKEFDRRFVEEDQAVLYDLLMAAVNRSHPVKCYLMIMDGLSMFQVGRNRRALGDMIKNQELNKEE